jgi:hypothetical protein
MGRIWDALHLNMCFSNKKNIIQKKEGTEKYTNDSIFNIILFSYKKDELCHYYMNGTRDHYVTKNKSDIEIQVMSDLAIAWNIKVFIS